MLKSALALFLYPLFSLLSPVVCSAQTTPVLFSLVNLTGTANNRSILVTPDTAQNPVWYGTNMVNLVPFTLNPVGGQLTTNLTPWGYTILVDGWPRGLHIVVPFSTNTLNVVGLFNTNRFNPVNLYANATILYPGSNIAFATNSDGSITISSTGSGGGSSLATITNGQPVFAMTNVVLLSGNPLQPGPINVLSVDADGESLMMNDLEENGSPRIKFYSLGVQTGMIRMDDGSGCQLMCVNGGGGYTFDFLNGTVAPLNAGNVYGLLFTMTSSTNSGNELVHGSLGIGGNLAISGTMPAGQLSGTIPNASLPPNTVTNALATNAALPSIAGGTLFVPTNLINQLTINQSATNAAHDATNVLATSAYIPAATLTNGFIPLAQANASGTNAAHDATNNLSSTAFTGHATTAALATNLVTGALTTNLLIRTDAQVDVLQGIADANIWASYTDSNGNLVIGDPNVTYEGTTLTINQSAQSITTTAGTFSVPAGNIVAQIFAGSLLQASNLPASKIIGTPNFTNVNVGIWVITTNAQGTLTVTNTLYPNQGFTVSTNGTFTGNSNMVVGGSLTNSGLLSVGGNVVLGGGSINYLQSIGSTLYLGTGLGTAIQLFNNVAYFLGSANTKGLVDTSAGGLSTTNAGAMASVTVNGASGITVSFAGTNTVAINTNGTVSATTFTCATNNTGNAGIYVGNAVAVAGGGKNGIYPAAETYFDFTGYAGGNEIFAGQAQGFSIGKCNGIIMANGTGITGTGYISLSSTIAAAGFSLPQTLTLAQFYTNIPAATGATTNWMLQTGTNGFPYLCATNVTSGGYLFQKLSTTTTTP